MSLDYLILDIKYHTDSDKFEIGGDLNRKGQRELVETFLLSQFGAGKDKSKPNKLATYYIRLKWYPEDDNIKVSSNTGNKGLREGILIDFLESLDNNSL